MVLNGTHAVIESIKKGASGTLYINTQHKLYRQIISLAKRNNCRIEEISVQELKSKGARQGLLFETKTLPNTLVPNLKQWLFSNQDKNLSILLLDHILDPQNLGAIMRSAALLSVNLIIQPTKRMAAENSVTARSASGAINIIPRCYESNLSHAVDLLKKNNIWVYALDMNGSSLVNSVLPSRCAFVLGSEHKGVSRLLRDSADEIISIDNNKSLESFNVSVSAAIVSYEYFRQHCIS